MLANISSIDELEKYMACGIYVYCVDEKPIYIGSSSRKRGGIPKRIREHSTESKFAPYLTQCSIKFMILPNFAQARGIESLLIDYYKPELNVVDNYKSAGNVNIEAILPYVWEPFDQYLEIKEKLSETTQSAQTKPHKNASDFDPDYSKAAKALYQTIFLARDNHDYLSVYNSIDDKDYIIVNVGKVPCQLVRKCLKHDKTLSKTDIKNDAKGYCKITIPGEYFVSDAFFS